MYSNDDLLPNLPLPTLEETISRLYDSAVPFGHSLYASVDGGNKANEMNRDSFVRECCAALADAQAVLQARSDTQVNWLGGWWEEFAYHRPRYPVAINTNTMAARLVDVGGDALSESDMWSNGNRCDNNSKRNGNKNSGGSRIAPLPSDPVRRPFAPVGWDDAISRAALCIRESLHFRLLMMQEAVEEVIRPPAGLLLCQDQFRKYYAMRVPRIGKDEIVMPDAPGDTEFAVLMFRGRMAFLRVASRGVQAPLLNLAEIRAAVRCAVDAMKRGDEEDTADVSATPAERLQRQLRHSVGLLTCAGRDEAATGFDLLRAASERNVQYLHKLCYHTLTVVSIDDDQTTSTIKTVAQALRSSAVEQPHNRWYDRATS